MWEKVSKKAILHTFVAWDIERLSFLTLVLVPNVQSQNLSESSHGKLKFAEESKPSKRPTIELCLGLKDFFNVIFLQGTFNRANEKH